MNIDAFDLNLLKALVAIYEERQITAAADRLGITQPGLSHILSRLRATFADELFVRRGGGMVPTAMAEDLYARVRPGLRQLQAGIAAPDAFRPETLERTFVLGMNDYGASVILPVLIRRMAKAAPKVRLKTRHYAHGTQFSDLRDGSIDVSVSVAGEHPGWVNSELLFREEAKVVADAANPLLGGKMTLKKYTACPHVIMAPDGGERNWVDDHLADLGVSRTVQHAVPHFHAIPAIIRGSSMISTLPARIAETLGRDAGISVYPLPFRAEAHQVVQLWPRRQDRDPVHRWLRREVRECLQ
ncbi:MAG: LysR family transcriptional regulator [Rhodospirillales bacterium]|nr:LysR family transcriptional regulator [Rhodospirillales bacterium]MBO6787977.1 LysR family transcriptional regulator [Rhodospirillales bacterium]